MLDDCGSNFSGGGWCVAYYVEGPRWAVDCSRVRWTSPSSVITNYQSTSRGKEGVGEASTHRELLLLYFPKNLRCPCPPCGAGSDWPSSPVYGVRTKVSRASCLLVSRSLSLGGLVLAGCVDDRLECTADGLREGPPARDVCDSRFFSSRSFFRSCAAHCAVSAIDGRRSGGPGGAVDLRSRPDLDEAVRG